jgi:putative protease
MNEDIYQTKRHNLIDTLASEQMGVTFRTPRLGIEGCCGRGCNGCLYFWHHSRYERARQLLKSKKQGALLSSHEMTSDLEPSAS